MLFNVKPIINVLLTFSFRMSKVTDEVYVFVFY